MQALKQENSKMVRDMDLVRDILLKIEQDPMCDGQHMVTLEMPDRSPEELYYHLTLLVEAGLVKADLNTSSLLPIVSRLTNDGHEFLANISDPGIWSRTKEKPKSLQGTSLSIMVQIAASQVKKHFGIP